MALARFLSLPFRCQQRLSRDHFLLPCFMLAGTPEEDLLGRGTREVAQKVRVFAMKPDNLSWIPNTYKVEGAHRLERVLLCPPYTHRGKRMQSKYIHRLKDFNKGQFSGLTFVNCEAGRKAWAPLLRLPGS